MENRYGKLLISKIMIENETELIAEIFSQLKSIVLRCDCNYASTLFEYVIYSPYFDLVKEGAVTPTHYIIYAKEAYDEDDESYETVVTVLNESTRKRVTQFTIDGRGGKLNVEVEKEKIKKEKEKTNGRS